MCVCNGGEMSIFYQFCVAIAVEKSLRELYNNK